MQHLHIRDVWQMITQNRNRLNGRCKGNVRKYIATLGRTTSTYEGEAAYLLGTPKQSFSPSPAILAVYLSVPNFLNIHASRELMFREESERDVGGGVRSTS